VARTPSESTAAQKIVTFYIDAHSYILRRVEITTGPTRSAPTFTLRFVAYGTVPLSRVPPHTFTLNAPATARVVVPVNHVQQLSVAQAVALPAMPAPLLSGAPDGLRLRWINEAVLPQVTVLRYAYFVAHQDVVVMVFSGQAQAVQHL